MNQIDASPGRRIGHIVIVGGGTAGWMAAAGMARMLDTRQMSVTVVESDEIGTIGVGEATIPSLITFNNMLGLDEAEFLKQVRGTIKLGIEFNNWSRLGETYFHPFGIYGIDRPEVRFHEMWLRLRSQDSTCGEFSEYSLNSVAARLNRYGRMQSNNALGLRHAYHFDAGLYAKLLRTYAEQRGVRRIEGRIEHVRQRDDGFVQSLVLANGQEVSGDLFVDCSGFRGLLISQTLGTDFVDWTHWLPCDSAVAVPCEKSGPLLPYTRSTAEDFGWRWRIPLQHRTGNGYVYASAHISDDAASARLLEGLDGKALDTPRVIRFQTGHRKKFWDKNVVALGLAGGFIEPLESTSIHLIQTGLWRLLVLLPNMDFSPVLAREYNSVLTQEYEQVRDFIVLHYKLTTRDDTALWRACRDMEIPDSLRHRMELFKEGGRIFRSQQELFTENSWLAVMLGQGLMPDSYDPIADSLPFPDMQRALEQFRQAVRQAAYSMPSHADFINLFCKSDLTAPAPG